MTHSSDTPDPCPTCLAWAGQAAKGHQAAAVVVDHAEDPDRYEAEHPDQGQVRAPKDERPPDDDTPAPLALLRGEGGDQLAAADQDLPEGLAACLKAEDPLGEAPELAGAQERLLDVEPDDPILDVRWRPVGGGAALPTGSERRRRDLTGDPAAVKAAKPTPPAARATRDAASRVFDREGAAEQEAREAAEEPVEETQP